MHLVDLYEYEKSVQDAHKIVSAFPFPSQFLPLVAGTIYASRRSRTRDTVKLSVCVSVCLSVCVCVYSSYNCSTVAMRRKLTASIGF